MTTTQAVERPVNVAGPQWPVPAPIKLCILSSSYRIGGLEKLLFYLCRGLKADRFDLTVCLLRARGPFADLMVGDVGPRVHVFDMASPFNLSALWDIVVLLRRIRPHIIHAFGLKGDVLSRCLHPFLGKPTLASGVADPVLPHARWRRWLNRTTSWCVATYWADCQDRAAFGVRQLGIPAEKIKVIYPGVDRDQKSAPTETNRAIRDELGMAREAPLVASLGNLRFKKGYHSIVESARVVLRRFPQVVFVLIGEDLTGGSLAALAEREGVAERFRFIGFREDPRPYLSAADVVLQPSLCEGLPRAILEAMSLGKPVVASSVGGIPEVIEHGVNGCLIPPGDSHALAQMLLEVLSDPRRGLELGRRAQETVKERFAVDRMVKEFEDLYGQLVEPVGVPV